MTQPLTWIAAALVALAVPAAAQEGATSAAPKPVVTVSKDVEYGTAAGESLKLDLYLPAEPATKPRPALLFVHGGGWCEGDKSGTADRARQMAELGYVVAAINYRLAPKHPYPAAVEDCWTALKWLREHAEEYQLNPAKIGAQGESAGGHLVTMLGLGAGAKGGDPLQTRPACVADFYGRTDLSLDQTPGTWEDYRQRFIGKTRAQAPDLYREASPLSHVDSKACPFLILQGSRDQQVVPEHSTKLFAALDKAGVETSLMMVAGAGHGFGNGAADQAWATTCAFFARHLGGRAQ
ncbi:MAG TPA: alpha/beta hydrolase [Armatimonadota bacterium]|jgi:acetyl esterase/lipase